MHEAPSGRSFKRGGEAKQRECRQPTRKEEEGNPDSELGQRGPSEEAQTSKKFMRKGGRDTDRGVFRADGGSKELPT